MNFEQKLFIDANKCTNCGVCTSVCPAKIFAKSENGVFINKCREKFCMNCGDCISVCPTGAAKNTDVLTESLNNKPCIEPSQLEYFLKKRRSIRSYKDEVLSENEKQYLSQVACLSPRGGHTQLIRNTEVVIIENKELLGHLLEYTYWYLESLNKKFSSLWIKIPKAFSPSLRDNINSTCNKIEQILAAKSENINMLTYDAPSLILLHSEKGNPISRENLTIMEYQIMLGAEALDLGTCFLGWISMALKGFQVKNSKELKALFFKLGIPENREILSAFSIGKKNAKYRNVKVRNEMKFKTV